VSPHSPEEGNRSSSRNVVFSGFYNTGRWTKSKNLVIHNWYSSVNIIRMIKSRRMRWAGHAARTGEKRECIHTFVEKATRKDITRKS
jgi:hypothetical protein